MNKPPRNRRKVREVSDHAMITLQRYFLRSTVMKDNFTAAREVAIAAHGTDWSKAITTTEVFHAWMYLDFWWASLYVVVEGFQKLGLEFPETTKLLNSSHRTTLANYRHGVFHFRETFFDPTQFALGGSLEGVAWVHKLHTTIGIELNNEIKVRLAVLVAKKALTDKPSN